MTARVEHGDGWTLVCGDWREHELPMVDMVCEDPPYGGRTHDGQRHGRRLSGAGNWCSTVVLAYDHLTPDDVEQLCASVSTVCFGWCTWMTSHDLIPHYSSALERLGRYVFAPGADRDPWDECTAGR